MKRIITIVSIVIYLTCTTQISQLLKLPLLIEHYFEHKRIDKCITFLKYMQMHYLMDESNNPDYARDMQLPFKTVEVSIINTFVLIPTLEFQLANFDFDVYSSIILSHHQWHSKVFLDHIWQPPKSPNFT